LALAKRGAAVCVSCVGRVDAADAVASEIVASGGRAMAIAADVADGGAVNALIERATAQLGPVTILVNNAGIAHKGTLEDYEPEHFEAMRRVNVDGIVHATRAVMGGMAERRYGRIVNIASIAGIGTALPGNAFYAATKAAAVILTRRFAMELGPKGITVNAVAPGFVRTDMTRRDLDDQAWEAVERQMAERTMLGRIGEPEDIANAVTFLVAPESAWITAQLLVVDGGRLDYIGHA
jgi:3-oxoacyl-[acyl-carrier protein] reductase